jgi:hypothetical protein
MANGNSVSHEDLKRLARIHINRYERRLDAARHGASGVRVDECEAYLALWQSIDSKGEYALLNSQERLEVQEAVESGE